MPVSIHGKEYVTVAERVAAMHEQLKEFSIQTELVSQTPMIVKAIITVPGKGVFTGYSAANPDKPIEKLAPIEVAESSAVGRAAGFAGFGVVEGIATADEIVKATTDVDHLEFDDGSLDSATLKQKEAIMKIADQAGHPIPFAELSKWTRSQASMYISERGKGSYYKIKKEQEGKATV